MKRLIYICCLVAFIQSCNDSSDRRSTNHAEAENALHSSILPDSSVINIPAIQERMQKIQAALELDIPIILLTGLQAMQQEAQNIAIHDKEFCKNIRDEKSKQPYRNEIFNVYQARPQEIPAGNKSGLCYKVEMYNYALNLTTTAIVDVEAKKVLSVNTLPQTQPDIPSYLKDLALKIAVHCPEVINALGYQPEEAEAMMANTKTALNNTKCERSMHLCVAPTFSKDDKALWAIVDLTDHRVVGVRWTQTGTTGPTKKMSEQKLKFDKIMECYCKQVNSLEKYNWKLNYVITTSDGIRISDVSFKGNPVINNAKIVDWHVSYSNTDGFGYSDAVGCPEFSQAAVVAVSDPKVSDIVVNGQTIGFALEQNFSSEQWPQPCNYNYLQRYEFYHDGRFRVAGASLGRGCGNNGTYRPVFRIALAGNQHQFSEWKNNSWQTWHTEQWNLQLPQTAYSPEGYQFKIQQQPKGGYYLMPNRGQMGDGGRGDFAYTFVTKQHFDKDEGENDLVSIGPCCNTDYHQGPEKFIEPTPESIDQTQIVIWYVCQMKNDDTPGKEYCWSESTLHNGVYKTTVYPCIGGPMFVPFTQ